MINADTADTKRLFSQFLDDAEKRGDDIALMMPVVSDGRCSGLARDLIINLFNDMVENGMCFDSSRARVQESFFCDWKPM